MATEYSYYHVLSLSLIFLLVFISTAQAQDLYGNRVNSSVSAIFVFGDSTVDSGNNNYLATLFRGNFPPYGRDFKNQMATGRFTNGKLGTDIVASYLGIKDDVPPYLDPTLDLEDLMTGVSFASAGSGYDPLTAQISGVIPILTQIDYFKEYIARLELAIGKASTEDLIRRALYFISCGTNDFIVNYFTLPIRRTEFTVEAYEEFLLDKQTEFFQGLHDLGARKFLVVGLSSMGCLPIIISIYSPDRFQRRSCIDYFDYITRDYNRKVGKLLSALQNSFLKDGGRIGYAQTYQLVLELMNDPAKFDYEETNIGCCGTGLLETSYLCNPHTYVCPDASKYIFWDSIHPTEKTYNIVINNIRPVIDRLVKD